MQPSTQKPVQHTPRTRPLFLNADAIMGTPHSNTTLTEGESVADMDFLTAVSCALYTHAKGLVETFDLGALHSVECHLSSGVIVMNHPEECGTLYLSPQPQPAL